MKMTIITDDQGNILGAVQGDSLSGKQGEVEASVSVAEGYQTHLMEVDDDMGTINDATIFQQRLRKHLDLHMQKAHGKP